MAGRFGPVITIEDEAKNRRQFKALGNAGKDLTKANRQVAKVVQTIAREAAGAGTPGQASAAKALVARATQSAATLVITNSPVYATGEFMGAKKYPQFPPWVGNAWDLADGTGPYAIKEAFSVSGRDQIMKQYQDTVEATLRAGGVDVQQGV